MIELMMVIAIVCVMMAIFFPVFMKAKERATGGVCYSNLRQVYQALELYSTNHGGEGMSKPVLPADLYELNIRPVISCKGRGGSFQHMWMFEGWKEHATQKRNPILVVDGAGSSHNGYALGLFRDGNVQRRRAEGQSFSFGYWD